MEHTEPCEHNFYMSVLYTTPRNSGVCVELWEITPQVKCNEGWVSETPFSLEVWGAHQRLFNMFEAE